MKCSGETRRELEQEKSGWAAASMRGDRRMEEQEAGATGSASGGRAATKKGSSGRDMKSWCVCFSWFSVASAANVVTTGSKRGNYRIAPRFATQLTQLS